MATGDRLDSGSSVEAPAVPWLSSWSQERGQSSFDSWTLA